MSGIFLLFCAIAVLAFGIILIVGKLPFTHNVMNLPRPYDRKYAIGIGIGLCIMALSFVCGGLSICIIPCKLLFPGLLIGMLISVCWLLAINKIYLGCFVFNENKNNVVSIKQYVKLYKKGYRKHPELYQDIAPDRHNLILNLYDYYFNERTHLDASLLVRISE